jgi:hypothetical protein
LNTYSYLSLDPGKIEYNREDGGRYTLHPVRLREKLKTIWECPNSKINHEIRSFLGLSTYCGQFISSFANTAKPLTKLTEEKRAFQWTPEVETAFETLKETLCTAPIFAYPQPREVHH